MSNHVTETSSELKKQSRRGEPARSVFIVICRGEASDEMKSEISWVLFVVVVLTSSSQTGGQNSALTPVLTPADPPGHSGTSASPDLTEDPGKEVSRWTHNPAVRDATSAETTTITKNEGTVSSDAVTSAVFKTHLLSTSSGAATSQHMNVSAVTTAHTGTASSSAAADGLSSTQAPRSTTPLHDVSTTESRTVLTGDPPTTFSSQPAHTVQDTSSTAQAFTTQSQAESQTTSPPLTSAPGQGSTGITHQEVPSELNIGDEDLKGPRYHLSSSLDPLLAGLLSLFIVATAIVFVVLFLKFRQRTNHPEFHRLQDLPMEDLMEDTPLSRYTY